MYKTTGVLGFSLTKKISVFMQLARSERALVRTYGFHTCRFLYAFYYINLLIKKSHFFIPTIKTKFFHRCCLLLIPYGLLRNLTWVLASMLWKSIFLNEMSSVLCGGFSKSRIALCRILKLTSLTQTIYYWIKFLRNMKALLYAKSYFHMWAHYPI